MLESNVEKGCYVLPEETKELIIEILKSDEVCSYFRKLIVDVNRELFAAEYEKKNEILSKESSELKAELQREKTIKKEMQEEYEKKLSESKVACEVAEKEKDEFIREERKKTDDILSRLNKYEERYKMLEEAYTSYLNLSVDMKQRLNNIFGESTVFSFLVAVSKWDNIAGIWNFTKRRIIEDDMDDVQDLIKLFRHSFELFTSIDANGKYELINPNKGDLFDSDKYSIKGIKTDGIIEKVLLDGVYDISLRKVVYKAVVEVM